MVHPLGTADSLEIVARLRERHPEKFLSEEETFARIGRGSRIFVGTGCAQPQYILDALVRYSHEHPRAIFDAELYVVLSFGKEQFGYDRFDESFRQHCFSIRDDTRHRVNAGMGDYNAVFLSTIPRYFRQGLIPIDAAIVQTSLPDEQGRVSLGISVDITRTAVECAPLVIAQMNAWMPFVHGDAVIGIDEIDCIIHHDEALYEYHAPEGDEACRKIGAYVAGLVGDGSTLAVGHGRTAQSIIGHLAGKQHLGIHTELLSNGLVSLLRSGTADNSLKAFDRGVTTATICMGSAETYAFLHDNPDIHMKSADYTNRLGVISRHDNMVAVNGVLSVDLTGQATAESIGKTFYSGLGGLADFARGAGMAERGKSILVMKSTALRGTRSRIVPFLDRGEGVTLNRGDVQYVVTEYGVARLEGKNIRERAMALIGIAHPDFRPWLMDEAREHRLIYRDQLFLGGEGGRYPEELETTRRTLSGRELFLRPIKFSDESLLKEFKYSLSSRSVYNRFITAQKDLHHEVLQKLVVIDYLREMAILAIDHTGGRERLFGIARYYCEESGYGNFSIAVQDEWQSQGIGTVLLDYIIEVARARGLAGFTVETLLENKVMIRLARHAATLGHHVERNLEGTMVHYLLSFANVPGGQQNDH